MDSGFQVQNYRSFSVELGFQIPIVSGITDSYSCALDSKAQDSRFHMQKFPGFRNPDSLTWREISVIFTSKDVKFMKRQRKIIHFTKKAPRGLKRFV